MYPPAELVIYTTVQLIKGLLDIMCGHWLLNHYHDFNALFSLFF